jgi:probable HAF family extracellular repeat protein
MRGLKKYLHPNLAENKMKKTPIQIGLNPSVLLLAALFAALPAAQAVPTYSVTPEIVQFNGDLQILSGFRGFATGINSSGQISIISGDPAIASGGIAASLFTSTPAGTATAHAIDNAGQIVGTINGTGSTPSTGYIYSGGVVTALTGLQAAFAMNNGGQVIGSNYANQIALDTNGTVTALPVTYDYSNYASQFYGRGLGINDNGLIVGESTTKTDAELDAGGVLTDLGTLGGTSSFATAINNAGQVVGGSTNASGVENAFLYSGGAMINLGLSPGFLSSTADGINSSGEVVGDLTAGSDGQYNFQSSSGFLWDNGVMYNLNSLIGPGSVYAISDAVAINASGQIAADACNTVTKACGVVLLTPNAAAVPEPSTLFMGGIGLLALGWTRRRKFTSLPSAMLH